MIAPQASSLNRATRCRMRRASRKKMLNRLETGLLLVLRHRGLDVILLRLRPKMPNCFVAIDRRKQVTTRNASLNSESTAPIATVCGASPTPTTFSCGASGQRCVATKEGNW